jgi:hypothetical protein
MAGLSHYPVSETIARKGMARAIFHLYRAEKIALSRFALASQRKTCLAFCLRIDFTKFRQEPAFGSMWLFAHLFSRKPETTFRG